MRQRADIHHQESAAGSVGSGSAELAFPACHASTAQRAYRWRWNSLRSQLPVDVLRLAGRRRRAVWRD